MKSADLFTRIGLGAACWLLIGAVAVKANEEEKGGAAKPDTTRTVPKPPLDWLAPYAAEPTDEASFTTLREKLFRTGSDAQLIKGLTWLAHAKSREVRVAAARGLAEAYLLGEHLGADPVPGIRAFARDPDPFVRTCLLSALGMYDSPLARELLYRHHTGEIPAPTGGAGDKILSKVREILPRYATAHELAVLKMQGVFAQKIWFANAPERPATQKSLRFETADIQVGQENACELKSAPGVRVWADLGASGGMTAAVGNTLMIWLGTPGSGRGGGGGAVIFGGVIHADGERTFIARMRELGGKTIRFWVRLDADSRAITHAKKRYPNR